MKKLILLALDLSSSCTGWCVYDIKSLNLKDFGALKSSQRGLSKLKPLHSKLRKMEVLANEIGKVAKKFEPDVIVIEEITGSKNRLGQKTLDMFHYCVLLQLLPWVIDGLVYFQDVGGKSGWRPQLEIRLSEADKKYNRKVRKMGLKKEVVGWKTLSQRWVYDNHRLKVGHDIADAICVGKAWLLRQSQEAGA